MAKVNVRHYEAEIQKLSKAGLKKLWRNILASNTPAWPPGKAFEYLIIRAFELEKAIVTWPYSVRMGKEEIEQIDGAIHLPNNSMSIIIESKDRKAINVAPIAKMRSQLLRRPSGTIGSVFTTDKFTPEALTLTEHTSPQTILLWERDNIDHCINNGCFIQAMIYKYRYAVEYALPNFDITTVL